MMAHLGELASRFARRWVPHPFVFAILLSALAFLLGVVFGGASAREMLEHWYGGEQLVAFGTRNPGFFSFLGFAMQMCLILVSGFALAHSRPVRALIQRVASWPKTTAGAAALTSLIAMLCALLNWGLGLIVGALLAREIGISARRAGRPLHYPLVVAAGYMGLCIWHGGFSGSAPLKATTDLADFLSPKTRLALAQAEGLLDDEAVARLNQLEGIARSSTPLSAVEHSELTRLRNTVDGVGLPLQRTIGSPLNLIVSPLLLLCVPCLFWWLAPKGEQTPCPASLAGDPPEAERDPSGPADWLENSFELSALIAVLGIAALVMYFRANGWASLDLNIVILAFLFVGLVLHGRPRLFVRAAERGAAGCGGIILQFPFYAGIMAMLAGSGVGVEIASGMVALSGKGAYLLSTFLASGLLNIFVPSGGGQWMIQADVAVAGALQLGIDPGRAVLAVAYGDQWTNLLQPFWALPLLGLTGMKARQIFGYTLVVAVLLLPLYALPLVLV